jgi:hypothetical protein
VLPLWTLCFLAFADQRPHIIQVTDSATSRPVPLIELKLPNEVKYWTDSAGIAALREPALQSQPVSISISGHGYEFPGETFFGKATASIMLKPGGRTNLQVRRTMIAERLYRLTGEGIYRDSIEAGLIKESPATSTALVLGQDTAVATPYRGKLFWIWGDTIGPAFWNFNVTAATSDLPPKASPGESPIHYTYFKEEGNRNRTKQMLPLPGKKGLVWIEGLFTVQGKLLATYTLQQGLKPPDECGVATYNDTSQVFEPWFLYPCQKESHRSSHPILYKTEEGKEYWYLYPWLRVPNDLNSIRDYSRWERREMTPPPSPEGLRAASIAWNTHRKRFILLSERPRFAAGEVWYAEALKPEGPYTPAVRIIHHNDYNFYNVVHHPFFDEQDGRVIYFEGTYTDAFSKAKEKTPRYNYNQILYRLDLADPGLAPAH